MSEVRHGLLWEKSVDRLGENICVYEIFYQDDCDKDDSHADQSAFGVYLVWVSFKLKVSVLNIEGGSKLCLNYSLGKLANGVKSDMAYIIIEATDKRIFTSLTSFEIDPPDGAE